MANPNRPLILVCDDEEGVRESLKLVLSDDYELCFARNGVEAVELLQKSKEEPRLMVLDIKMPKSHGLEILRKVKAIKPHLPVIMVTGYQSVETAREAIKAGAADYIPKPFESKHLLSVVATHLAKK